MKNATTLQTTPTHLTAQTIHHRGRTLRRDVRQVRTTESGDRVGYVTIDGSRTLVSARLGVWIPVAYWMGPCPMVSTEATLPPAIRSHWSPVREMGGAA